MIKGVRFRKWVGLQPDNGTLLGLFRRLGPFLLLMLCSTACAHILGIDDPALKANEEGGASGSDSNAGDAEVTPPRSGASSSAGSTSGTASGGTANGGNTSAGEAGQVPEGGIGGAPSDVRITALTPTTTCANSPVAIELKASGGRAPYVWTKDTLSLNLSSSGSDNEVATLSGSSPVAALISVRDHDGQVASHELKVTEVPVIQPPSPLPTVCPNEVYDLQLASSGGTASPDGWWSDDLPASSGLHVTPSGKLEGKFLGVPAGPTTLTVHVKLSDGGQCVATPIALSIHILGEGASECPMISFDGQTSRRTAPALCIGGAYAPKLLVTGGVEPYIWSSSVHPASLSIAPIGAISGTYTTSALIKRGAAEPLTLRVQDGKGREIETTYDLAIRQSCWFAYVAKSASDAQLTFFDPELGNRKSPPAAAAGDLVTDFKFSPNGRYVGYRVTTAGGSSNLSLIELSSFREQRFAFEGVTRYSWSPDSAILAVAYKIGADSVLGGVNVANASPGTGSAISFPPLVAISATPTSESVWFGADPQQLAYLVTKSGTPQLETVKLQMSVGQPSGFDSPTDRGVALVGSVRLRAATDGVFAVPKSFSIQYYPADGSPGIFHDGVVVAPSNRFVAKAAADALNVFHPADNSTATAASPLMAQGCGTLLSWAKGTERLACAHTTQDATQELNFFDLASGTNSSTDSLNLSATAPLQVPTLQRRLFSPAGGFFAYVTSSNLTIYSSSKKVAISHDTVDSPAELVFSGEDYLLEHRGTGLTVYDLSDLSAAGIPVQGALAQPITCVEDFQDTKVGWCGAERTGAPYVWSSDARFVAFQLAQGTLQVFSTRTRQQQPVDDRCAQDCVLAGQFTFQP